VTGKPRLEGLLILSYFFPPMSNGPSFMMESLLAQLDVRGSTVFCGRPDRYSDHLDRPSRVQTNVRQFDLPAWWPVSDGRLRIGAIGNVLAAFWVAAATVRALRRPDIRGLLVVYPKQHFLLAALVAASISRKPFAVYFTDVFVEGLPRGRAIARLLERFVRRRANLVFAMNDALRLHLERRLPGVPIVTLPPVYEEEPQRGSELELAGRPSVVFTGAVYSAQADALRRLITALDRLDDLDTCLHLVSQMEPAELALVGITESDRVRLRRTTRAGARAAQRAGDILFLPLAFDSPELVQTTSSPSKMPEYLAAGKPVLVHAPATSYLAAYARARGFAEVVDEPDVDLLAAAIKRLATDDALRRKLVAASMETLEEHRVEGVARTLHAALEQMLDPAVA
jgi:glycosyltransferase involved in cell wall biosynthesis